MHTQKRSLRGMIYLQIPASLSIYFLFYHSSKVSPHHYSTAMEIPLPLMNNEPRIPSRAANDLKTKGEIIFRHPGYHSPTNVLLTLAKADCEDYNGTVVFGLHHGTALLACQIIANNAFNSGYLAMDSAGSQTVNVPLDGLLTDHEYYFFINGIGLLFTQLI